MAKPQVTAQDVQFALNDYLRTAQEWATPQVQSAVSWATPKVQTGVTKAAPAVSQAVTKAAPKIADLFASLTPRIQEATLNAAPKIAETGNRFSQEFLPKFANSLGDRSVAAQAALRKAALPEQHEQLLARISDDPDLIERAQLNAPQAAAAAAEIDRKYSLVQVEDAKPSSAKGWLVAGLVLAVAGGAYALWRATRPVEDPWEIPNVTPQARAEEKSEEDDETVAEGETRARHVSFDRVDGEN